MQIVILIVGMVIVGLLMGVVAGSLWRDERPLGVPGDYLVSVAVAVAVGLLDWYVIPAMGFSDAIRNLGVALEPPLSALLVLWLIKRAKA